MPRANKLQIILFRHDNPSKSAHLFFRVRLLHQMPPNKIQRSLPVRPRLKGRPRGLRVFTVCFFIFHLSLPLHVFLPHYFVVLKHPIFPRRKFLKKQVIQDFYLTSRVNSSFQNCLPCLSSQDLWEIPLSKERDVHHQAYEWSNFRSRRLSNSKVRSLCPPWFSFWVPLTFSRDGCDIVWLSLWEYSDSCWHRAGSPFCFCWAVYT